MKKIILFSLVSIMCSTVTTKINAMHWRTVTRLNNRIHYPGSSKIILSNHASWEQFYKKQDEAISLLNIGNSIAQNHEQKPNDCLSELLTTTAKMYANTIIQQEELVSRYYTRSNDQKRYQKIIKALRNQLRK